MARAWVTELCNDLVLSGHGVEAKEILARDAEQRAAIERLDQLTTMQDGGIRMLHEQIVKKDAEIVALKQALKFYAEPQHYGLHGGSNEWVLGDAGSRARQAMGKEHS